MKLEFLFAEDEKSERQRFVHKYNNYIPADARVSTHGVSLHMKSSICYLNNELDHNAQESPQTGNIIYESFATVGEIRVYRRADFQSGSRVLKKVF